jgi:hypothetical protein
MGGISGYATDWVGMVNGLTMTIGDLTPLAGFMFAGQSLLWMREQHQSAYLVEAPTFSAACTCRLLRPTATRADFMPAVSSTHHTRRHHRSAHRPSTANSPAAAHPLLAVNIFQGGNRMNTFTKISNIARSKKAATAATIIGYIAGGFLFAGFGILIGTVVATPFLALSQHELLVEVAQDPHGGTSPLMDFAVQRTIFESMVLFGIAYVLPVCVAVKWAFRGIKSALTAVPVAAE